MNAIILDTDPGIDDAVAIAVLLKSCKERVRLVLSSYGNISVEQTTRNALTILSLLDAEIPVVKGAAQPQNKTYTDASYIHGVDGLGGLGMEIPITKPIEGDFLKLTYDTIIAAGRVDYITLGPLTNLALLMKRYPDVISHIAHVITMGGGLAIGNVTEFAEFNIYCDAESADYVFEHAQQLTLVPLNITETVAFSLPQIEAIGGTGTPLAAAMKKILTANYHACLKFGGNGSTMHDATAVLSYLYPELFTLEQCGIRVDCSAHYGETLRQNDKSNVALAVDTDPQLLLEKITACIC